MEARRSSHPTFRAARAPNGLTDKTAAEAPQRPIATTLYDYVGADNPRPVH
jgi:hypothetical protein